MGGEARRGVGEVPRRAGGRAAGCGESNLGVKVAGAGGGGKLGRRWGDRRQERGSKGETASGR